MAISVSCNECGKEYNVKDDAAGKKFKCKDCGAVIQVPEALGSEGDEFAGLEGDLEEDWPDSEEGGPAATVSRLPNRKRRKRRSGGSRQAAKDRLKGPAISLIVVASISLAHRILDLLLVTVFGLAAIPQQQQQFMNNDVAVAQIVGGIVGDIVGIVFGIIVLIGAIKMLQVRSFGLAMTAAVLSVIPLCSPCCCLGIPFGIWALVVLNDESVKSAFQ